MSSFFRLLPTDLHVLVLHDWISCADDLIRVLSALDVACSQADRSCFRGLVRELPPFGKEPSLWKGADPTLIVNYLQWLSDREVPLKSLLLKGDNTAGLLVKRTGIELMLRFVDLIDWHQATTMPSELLGVVLSACPNVTSFESEHIPSITDGLLARVPKLRTFNCSRWATVSSRDLAGIRTLGPQLQELRISCCTLTAELADLLCQACPLLRMLRVEVLITANIMQVVQRCKHLSDLELCRDDFASGEPDTWIVVANKQIKRFTLHSRRVGDRVDCSVFAIILETRPDLEYLYLVFCEYIPAQRSLRLQFIITPSLRRILDVCTDVEKLNIYGGHYPDDFLELLAERLGGKLLAFDIAWDCISSAQYEFLLRRFGPSLRSLSADFGAILRRHWQWISIHCPLLESLAVNGSQFDNRLRSTFDAQIVDALVKGCPRLKKLKIVLNRGDMIVVEHFQPIFDNRLRLEELRVDLTEKDKAWIRNKAKEHQLLPVPKLFDGSRSWKAMK